MSIFDESAKLYDSWYETKLGKFVDDVETRCAFGLLDLKAGAKILEIGCGSGNFSVKLARMGYEVIAIDSSIGMLNLAKNKAKKNLVSIDFKRMNATKLLFENESFDAVFSMAAFEFISDSNKAMDEMMKILKPGGEIIIGTIHSDSKWGEFYNSDEMKKNSVFKYAKLKSMDEMKMFYPHKLVEKRECLFIAPDSKEKDIDDKNEKEMEKNGEKGGFICLKWIK